MQCSRQGYGTGTSKWVAAIEKWLGVRGNTEVEGIIYVRPVQLHALGLASGHDKNLNCLDTEKMHYF